MADLTTSPPVAGGRVRARRGSGLMIESFLADAKAMGDRCPTEAELRKARQFLRQLEIQTREDHLRSVDELLSQVPSEFQAKIRQLQDAEQFVLLAASSLTEKVAKRLEGDADLVNAIDRDGHTALHSAAACNNVDIVSLLIEKGANPNTQDYEGFTALHWAVENTALDVVEVLLDHGVDTTIRTNAGLAAADFIPTLKPKYQPILEDMLLGGMERAGDSVAGRPTSTTPARTTAHRRRQVRKPPLDMSSRGGGGSVVGASASSVRLGGSGSRGGISTAGPVSPSSRRL